VSALISLMRSQPCTATQQVEAFDETRVPLPLRKEVGELIQAGGAAIIRDADRVSDVPLVCFSLPYHTTFETSCYHHHTGVCGVFSTMSDKC